jgi:hypothetical protein
MRIMGSIFKLIVTSSSKSVPTYCLSSHPVERYVTTAVETSWRLISQSVCSFQSQIFSVDLLMFFRSSEREWLLVSSKKQNTSVLNIIRSLILILNLAVDFQTARARFLRSLVYRFLQDWHKVTRYSQVSGRLLESGVGLKMKHPNSVQSILVRLA